MNKNYHSSIEKWRYIKERIKLMESDITEDELRDFWNIKIWYKCGFCYEFGGETKSGDLNCNKCPLNKKHCNQYFNICRKYENTMFQIKIAILVHNFEEAIRLVEYFIRCMQQHKNKFKQEKK